MAVQVSKKILFEITCIRKAAISTFLGVCACTLCFPAVDNGGALCTHLSSPVDGRSRGLRYENPAMVNVADKAAVEVGYGGARMVQWSSGGGGGGGSYSGLLKSKGDGGTSSVTTVADEKAVVLVWEWDSGPAPAPACEMIRWVMQGGSVRERCGVRRRR
jgi:hypothetical protein